MDMLKLYGVSDKFINESLTYNNLKLGRVICQHKSGYTIVTNKAQYSAQISGKLIYKTTELAKFPAVGDYVMVSVENEKDIAIIHNILDRKSVFLRTAVEISEQSQVIASNIDILFICMSINENYNLNRLERYISVAWDSGAKPIIVLTKADLCQNLEQIIKQVEDISNFCDIITTSIFENNIIKFENYFKQGITAAFVGSSGVGKSTLVNQIIDKTILETKETGKGDKGRHTTTGREMFICKLGGVVIDTPGMREIGIQSNNLSKSFEDIENLAQQCKFSNCTHTKEPGCAVKQAIEDGLIDLRRFDNYIKIKIETSYEGLNSRQIGKKKNERLFKEFGGIKNARKILKSKHK